MQNKPRRHVYADVEKIIDQGKYPSRISIITLHAARLAQSVEHQTFNLRVVSSSPTVGAKVLLQ